MTVCIAEKPSVAQDIARVIGANRRCEGYFEGNGFQVTWTFGHLCRLKTPEEYDDGWKRWSLDSLPIVPEQFGIHLLEGAHVKKQFKVINCRINGVQKTTMVDVRASLTDLLRKDYRLTSVKEGCEVGECGACAVIIDGECYNACIYLAIWADGKAVLYWAAGRIRSGQRHSLCMTACSWPIRHSWYSVSGTAYPPVHV